MTETTIYTPGTQDDAMQHRTTPPDAPGLSFASVKPLALIVGLAGFTIGMTAGGVIGHVTAHK